MLMHRFKFRERLRFNSHQILGAVVGCSDMKRFFPGIYPQFIHIVQKELYRRKNRYSIPIIKLPWLSPPAATDTDLAVKSKQKAPSETLTKRRMSAQVDNFSLVSVLISISYGFTSRKALYHLPSCLARRGRLAVGATALSHMSGYEFDLLGNAPRIARVPI